MKRWLSPTGNFMAENKTMEGVLGRCNVFVVTYYWTLPAVGLHLYTNVTLIVISISMALFGIIANILVVLSYFKNSHLRTLSNIAFISLACSDLLVTTVVKPLHVTRFVLEIYGGHNCILWTSKRLLSYFSIGVSLLSATVVSIERFITLAFPYRYQTVLTKFRINVVITAIWLLTFVLVISNINLIPYTVLRAICTVIVILCISTLFGIWIWIYRLLRNHRRRITTNQQPSFISKSRKQTYKNTQTSGVIVTALILSYLPLVVMLAYYWTEPGSFTGIYLVTPWGETIILAHSVFNPLYVFWRKSEFRQTARNCIHQFKWQTQKKRVIKKTHAERPHKVL